MMTIYMYSSSAAYTRQNVKTAHWTYIFKTIASEMQQSVGCFIVGYNFLELDNL